MPVLDFKGKQFVYAHHLSVPFRQLDINAKKSVTAKGGKPGLDDNLIIHGDNLHALKALLPKYAGKVKCIYIDPPYNTGNEGWCYNDNVNAPLMKEWIKKEGNPVDKEDLERHDKWLCMMWPRLQLLHELLADDGLIFISIDDNEKTNLTQIITEIFNENNFVNDFVWRSRLGKGATATHVAQLHEYVICFSKNIHQIEMAKDVRQSDEDKRERLRQWGQGDRREDRPSMYYPISGPSGKDVFPIKPDGTDGRWRLGEDKARQLLKEGMLEFDLRDDGKYEVYKIIKAGHTTETAVDSILTDGEVGTTAHGSKELKEIFDGEQIFDYPKPSKLLKYLLGLHLDKDAIVLDSFAGSGTTAHAVLALNKEDGGNRKFILVECEDYADTITAERVRRVIKGVPGARDDALKSGLGGSFTFCELGKEINIDNLLKGGELPDYDELARYAFYTATGLTLDKVKQGTDYFIGETDQYRVHMIYKPDADFLRSGESALNANLAASISKSRGKKTALVFATHKFMGQKELTEMGVTYCQLPYAIHRVMGD